MIGLEKNCVRLYTVDETSFKQAFVREQEKLAKILEGYYVSIEHIGSTAVPGLLAKPIIDIAVGVNDFSSIECIITILEKNGYIYLFNRGEITRKIFVKTNGNIRTHHIHVEEIGKQNWQNHINFRDKLLESEELRNKYVDLKKQLYALYANDRDKYTSAKAQFIERVLSNV